MKKKKYLGLLIFLIMVICSISNCKATSSNTYDDYIQKNLVPSFGIAKTGKMKTNIGYDLSGWCKTKGIVSAYTRDFNGDKKKECIVLYIEEDGTLYGEKAPIKALHLAVLSKRNGKIVETDEIMIESGIDRNDCRDLQLFVKNYQKNLYLVMQSKESINIGGTYFLIMSINRKGKIIINKGIFDLAEGGGYYWAHIGRTSGSDYENGKYQKKTLYEVGDFQAPENADTICKNIVRKQLSKYGLKLTNNYGKYTLKTSGMKKILKIKENHKYMSNSTFAVYKIIDYTNFG